jgi:hypothetical protein
MTLRKGDLDSYQISTSLGVRYAYFLRRLNPYANNMATKTG